MVAVGSGNTITPPASYEGTTADFITDQLPLAQGRQYQQLYYFMQRNVMTGETVKLRKAGASRGVSGQKKIKPR